MNSKQYEIHQESTKPQRTNRQYQKVRLAVNIAVILAVAILFYLGIRPPRVEINENYVKISGMYGVELRPVDIQRLELRDSIPEIQTRINGMDLFGFARRGIYEVEGLGRTRLISFSYGGPFIYMYTGNEWIIINFNNPAETENLYQQLKEIVENQ